jgi:diguanylate cyclase (GGDEF)-like protein/putative nucleotidyltransferase with HDIG domain
MSVIMIDIDHFKQVNDCYGHATGDEVIRQIAATLQRVVGEDGVVCRYGGEEFCILTTHESMDQVIALAHSICDEVSTTPVAKIELTVSAGISTRSFGAMDVQHLLDQADQSLYIAKRHRNRVVCWDACPKNQWTQRGGRQLELGFDGTGSATPVHVATLNALLSALEFRDSATAEHARRVATLCLAVGRDLLDGKHVYALKVAGLLHDIGKIGVPDAILLKPGPLTDDEWETMRRHDEMSVQIVRSALASDEVAQIIRLHHVRYNNGRGSRHEQGLDPDISLAGRILTVCDAFDAMIADRVYRRGMTHEEAFGELRRCAPDQFDPTVVEALIQVVSANPWLTQSSRDLVPLPPDTAIRVGSHVERLTSAIADGNLVELKELVTQLRCDPATVEILPIQQAAHRLHEALECAEPELDQLLSMTQDIVDLCRSSHAMDGSQTAASRETAPATT